MEGKGEGRGGEGRGMKTMWLAGRRGRGGRGRKGNKYGREDGRTREGKHR